jgi:hypothetical protein
MEEELREATISTTSSEDGVVPLTNFGEEEPGQEAASPEEKDEAPEAIYDLENRLTIIVNCPTAEGEVLSYRLSITVDCEMQAVFNFVSKRRNIMTDSLRFLLDGKNLQGHEIASTTGLEENSQIDCMMEMTGGVI